MRRQYSANLNAWRRAGCVGPRPQPHRKVTADPICRALDLRALSDELIAGHFAIERVSVRRSSVWREETYRATGEFGRIKRAIYANDRTCGLPYLGMTCADDPEMIVRKIDVEPSGDHATLRVSYYRRHSLSAHAQTNRAYTVESTGIHTVVQLGRPRYGPGFMTTDPVVPPENDRSWR